MDTKNNANFRVNFRDKLRAARMAKYRSAADFATAIDAPLPTVQAWESNRFITPPLYYLPAICRALDMSSDELLGISPPVGNITASIIGNANNGDNITHDCRYCSTVNRLLSIIESLTTKPAN